MKQYFEEMINQSNPVTEDTINRMKQKRMDNMRRLDIEHDNIKPTTSFGTIINIGDMMLYFVDMTTGNAQMKSLVLREINKLDVYTYMSMDNLCPVLKK